MTELIVNTKFGKVEGFIEDGVTRWYGIPYADMPRRSSSLIELLR